MRATPRVLLPGVLIGLLPLADGASGATVLDQAGLASTGFVGGVVIDYSADGASTFAWASQQATVVTSAQAAGDGIPVYMLCSDNAADWLHCTLTIYQADDPLHPLAEGARLAHSASTATGLSIVSASIPASAYAGPPLSHFLVVPGVNGFSMNADTIVAVAAA